MFIIGYGFIIFEHDIKINKAASAILTGTGGSILIIGSAVHFLQSAWLS